MMQWGQMGAWFLFFLTAVIPAGVLLQRDDSSLASDSELTSEAQIYRPVLQPSEAVPPIGTYVLNNLDGKPCIKATLGAEYIVIEKKKTWYVPLDPSRVSTSGHCGRGAAVLSLTLQDRAASLQLSFTEDKSDFYVDNLTAHVSPLPVCPGCANKTYSGALAREKLFAAGRGQSFKCQSEQRLKTSAALSVKLVALQLQAFSLQDGSGDWDYHTSGPDAGSLARYNKYNLMGKPEVECRLDFNKRVLPVIAGATVVGLCLIVVLTFLFIKDRRRGGYERL